MLRGVFRRVWQARSALPEPPQRSQAPRGLGCLHRDPRAFTGSAPRSPPKLDRSERRRGETLRSPATNRPTGPLRASTAAVRHQPRARYRSDSDTTCPAPLRRCAATGRSRVRRHCWGRSSIIGRPRGRWGQGAAARASRAAARRAASGTGGSGSEPRARSHRAMRRSKAGDGTSRSSSTTSNRTTRSPT